MVRVGCAGVNYLRDVGDGRDAIPVHVELADARIDFYGSGVVANQQRPGVLYTLLDWLWPF